MVWYNTSTLTTGAGQRISSTSLATNDSGVEVTGSRTLYYPYGEVRWSASGGTLPTDYTFTGQREEASLGLYDYNARFYDPTLGRFVSADTIVPNPGNPQSLNRYSYVLGNPLKYSDPSGHCIPGLDCPGDLGQEDTSPILSGILFTVDPGQSWHVRDQNAVLNAAQTSARAQLRALRQRNREYAKTGDFDLMVDVPAPDVLFKQVFGDVAFHQSALSCQDVHGVGCWAFTANPQIIIYTNAPQGRYTFQNAAHELGHAFAQRSDRQPYNDLNAAQIAYVDPDTNQVIRVAGGGWGAGYVRTDRGYAGPFPGWQQSTVRTANEDFADMFLGWSYNHFANDAAGAARNQWMTVNMPRWIALAVTGTP